jgi:tetratricopeptide (TPR) repeat protein
MSLSLNTLIKAGALAVAFAVAGSPSPVLAAGGDSGGGGTNTNAPAPPATKAACEKAGGKWANNKCTGYKVSQLEKDWGLYRYGRAEALAGHYENALALLGAIENKNDAMVLTMIGYSKRKLGHTDEGIAIYHQALAIDPNNVNTHEYLGEGYLAAGRVDLAELELDTLNKLCGVGCEQYQDLQKALVTDNSWH